MYSWPCLWEMVRHKSEPLNLRIASAFGKLGEGLGIIFISSTATEAEYSAQFRERTSLTSLTDVSRGQLFPSPVIGTGTASLATFA